MAFRAQPKKLRARAVITRYGRASTDASARLAESYELGASAYVGKCGVGFSFSG